MGGSSQNQIIMAANSRTTRTNRNRLPPVAVAHLSSSRSSWTRPGSADSSSDGLLTSNPPRTIVNCPVRDTSTENSVGGATTLSRPAGWPSSLMTDTALSASAAAICSNVHR